MTQQYTFDGKPNNGTIILNGIDKGGPGDEQGTTYTSYLLGNPYPSAIDARTFITDNSATIEGTLQLWEQWDGNTHYLAEYQGGYGFITNLSTLRAYQYPGIGIDGPGAKRPTFFIPVAQAFFVQVINDGPIVFNNTQRIFIKESDADGSDDTGSVFMRTSEEETPGAQ